MDRIRKTANLALIRSLPDLVLVNIKNGRLKGRFKKLIKLVDLELDKLQAPTISEIDFIGEKLKIFGDKTGWHGKHKHVMTYVSFLLSMIDGHGLTEVESILNDITEYFERACQLKPICCNAGAVANEKWNKIWEET